MELFAQLKSRLQYAELKIRVLEEQLRLMRVEKYGTGGEKLYHVQMKLFELGPMVGEVTVFGVRWFGARSTDPASIRATRNCLRTYLAWRGPCLARRISACAIAAAKKRW